MNLFGLVSGLTILLVTAFDHILIIKGEYYCGTTLWPIFLIIGLSSIVASIFVKSDITSTILGIIGFTFLWSIHEIFKQKERVEKGWFPKNSRKKIYK